MSGPRHWFVGECMAELRRAGPGLLAQSFSGDVYNTAVYFARAMGPASSGFVSAVGSDVLSEALLADMQAQGLDTRHVARIPGAQPGLYWIEVDARGERSFLYWRTQSAARRMLDDAHFAALHAEAPACALLYFSGITLAILDDARRMRLLALAEQVKQAGGWVAFDSNYRPALWDGMAQAKHWCDAAFHACTHALVTFEDERQLHADSDPAHTVQRLLAGGAREAVVKLGAEGCMVQTSQMRAAAGVPAVKASVVDTTAAGDSFNAAYLAARLAGSPAQAAAQAGNRLAAVVVSHYGAIIDKAAHGLPQ